jgi:hypothetical protein
MLIKPKKGMALAKKPALIGFERAGQRRAADAMKRYVLFI